MTNNEATTNGHAPEDQSQSGSTSFAVKTGLAKMLKGGVIMDVVNAEQVWISLPLHVIQIIDLPQKGENSGRSGRMCSHGSRASPSRYPSPRWCGTHVRPQDDQGDNGHRHHSCHGESKDRAFRRVSGTPLSHQPHLKELTPSQRRPDPRSPRGRLY